MTQYTYEPSFKQLDTITDPLNHVTDLNYDAKGCLDTITDGANRTTSFDCNGAGQITSLTDAMNKTTTSAYSHGDLASVTDPLGRVMSRFTDAGGRVLAIKDSLNYLTRYAHDNLNQLTSITDAKNKAIVFEYDEDGNLRFVRDQRGATESATQFAYNDQNLVSTRIDPLGRSETFTYDDRGNLLTWTDRKSQVTEFRYDPLDRVTFAGFNRTGSPPTYSYASTIDYTFDVGGRLTSVADSSSGAGTLTRGYDDLDRLTSEIQPNAASPGVVYTYYADGTRQTMTVPGQSQVTYAYNNAGQLTSLTKGTATVSLGYFADGRLQTLTLKPSPTPVTQGYTYDDAGQLSQVAYTHGSSTDDLSYGYDPAGRRTAVHWTYGRTSLPAATTATAVYDLANRLTSWNGATVSHDLNGNLTNDGTFTFTYNPRNQLTLVKQGNQTRGSYTYDGLGRRVSRTVGNSTTKPAYDGWNLAQERASNGSVTANYLTGLGLDQPFIRTPSSGSARYYLSDPLGSIVGLASPTGTVPTTYTYEPYGKTTAGGTGSDSFFGFTGRENDSTGTLSLYNYRARSYSPTLQRFLTEDPIGFSGGDANLYEYVRNAPVTGTDPLGLILRGLGAKDFMLEAMSLSGANIIYPGGRPNLPAGRQIDVAERGEITKSALRYRRIVSEGRFIPTIAGGVHLGQLHAFYSLFGPGASYFIGGGLACHKNDPGEAAALCVEILKECRKRARMADRKPDWGDDLSVGLKKHIEEDFTQVLPYLSPRDLFGSPTEDLHPWWWVDEPAK